MNEKEKQIVLSETSVQQTILKIDDVNVLREIFKRSPIFFSRNNV